MTEDSYPPAVTVTSAVPNATERQRDAALAVAEVVLLAVILVMALLGNGLVLAVLLRRKRRQNPLHQFMLNLCVADLVVALFQVTHLTHARTRTCRQLFLLPLRFCPSWFGMLRAAFQAPTSCAVW